MGPHLTFRLVVAAAAGEERHWAVLASDGQRPVIEHRSPNADFAEFPHGKGPGFPRHSSMFLSKILVLSDNHCNLDVSIGHMLLLKMLLE